MRDEGVLGVKKDVLRGVLLLVSRLWHTIILCILNFYFASEALSLDGNISEIKYKAVFGLPSPTIIPHSLYP